jgi:hypothetical protein
VNTIAHKTRDSKEGSTAICPAVLPDAKSRPVAVLTPKIFPIGNLEGLCIDIFKIFPVRDIFLA